MTPLPGDSPALFLLRALQFGDSMLPVGAFAFSAGLESAVQQGVVKNADDLAGFVRTALEQAAIGDAVATACAVRSSAARDWVELIDIDTAVLARKPGEENRSMTVRMGKKLMELAADAAESPLAREWLLRLRAGETPGTWPVAQGILFADFGLTAESAVAVHQYGLAATILNASLRLMRVTHIDTQRILSKAIGEMSEQCRRAANTPWRHMTSFAPMNDILAAAHAHAHVRLFMN